MTSNEYKKNREQQLTELSALKTLEKVNAYRLDSKSAKVRAELLDKATRMAEREGYTFKNVYRSSLACVLEPPFKAGATFRLTAGANSKLFDSGREVEGFIHSSYDSGRSIEIYYRYV